MSVTYNLEHIVNGEGRCRENDGLPCDQCEEAWQDEAEYWYSKWETATDEERDPEAYRQSMIDAGRGHLVKGDHNPR